MVQIAAQCVRACEYTPAERESAIPAGYLHKSFERRPTQLMYFAAPCAAWISSIVCAHTHIPSAKRTESEYRSSRIISFKNSFKARHVEAFGFYIKSWMPSQATKNALPLVQKRVLLFDLHFSLLAGSFLF